MADLVVARSTLVLRPDPTRVLLRPFVPGNAQRMRDVAARVLAIPEAEVDALLGRVTTGFAARHQALPAILRNRAEQLGEFLPPGVALSPARAMLLGAYFLCEYSVEAAALFNPSLVPHPDQSGLPEGAVRIVLSLRATGEGHISSITFRTGTIDAGGCLHLVNAAGNLLTEPSQLRGLTNDKGLFVRRLHEIGLLCAFTQRAMDRLSDPFTLDELRAALDAELQLEDARRAANAVWMLARSNYEVQFQPGQQLSERILFPATASQRNGIEDARFVRFRNDDGSFIYYATFTAYDGRAVVPELVETADFTRFRFITLNGPAALNKGMALFPRRINGRYAMLSRQDSESISVMFSDNVHFWNERQALVSPVEPWELVQMGNCGPPMETSAGWLVLSHGVGPMRRYCIGAFLLDRDDPSRVIARLRAPLLEPNETEREGYVPNVVYSCGGLIHNGTLHLPYGLSDCATGFATVPVADLLAAMEAV